MEEFFNVIVIKYVKILFSIFLILAITLPIISGVQFLFPKKIPIPRNLFGLLWPNPEKSNDNKIRYTFISIRGCNLFLCLFSLGLSISFFLGNIYTWVVEKNPDGINNLVIGVGFLIVLFVSGRLTGNYMRRLLKTYQIPEE